MFRDVHERSTRRRQQEQKEEAAAEADEQDDWIASQHLSFLHAPDYGADEEEDEAALVDAEVAQLEEILRASQQQQQHRLSLAPLLPRVPALHSHQHSSLHARGQQTSTSSATSSASSRPVTAPPPPPQPALNFDVHPALHSDSTSLSANALQVALDSNLSYQQSIQSTLSDIEAQLEQLSEQRRLLLAVYQHSWLHSYSATTSASPLLSLPRAALFTFPYLIAPPTSPAAATASPDTAATPAAASPPDCLLRTHLHRHHAVAWNEQERLALELGIQHTNQLAALRHAIAALGADAKPDAVQAAIQSVRAASPQHWLSVGTEAVDWPLLAASYVPSRSAMDCRLQWTNRLDPRINHAVWSEAEDKFLVRHAPSSAIRPMRHWVDVAAGMATQRTAWQCMTRYVRTLRPVQVKDTAWTEEENRRLKWLVEEEEGSKDWVRVAERMDGRTDQQCMHRYLKVLRPAEQSQLAKGMWTVAADLRLRLAVLAHGLRWSEVARLVGDGRSDVSCRERWVNVLRGGEKRDELRRGGWSGEEEARLRAVVAEVGEVWVAVSDRMQGRTDRMCRKKWRRLQNNDRKEKDRLAQQQQQPQQDERKDGSAAEEKGEAEEAAVAEDREETPQVNEATEAEEQKEAVVGDAVMKQDEQDEKDVKAHGRLRSYRKRQGNEVSETEVRIKRNRRSASNKRPATPRRAVKIKVVS